MGSLSRLERWITIALSVLLFGFAVVRFPALVHQNIGALSLASVDIDRPPVRPSDMCAPLPKREHDKVQRALHHLALAARHLPNETVLTLLGRAYCRSGQWERALTVWRQVLSINPWRDDVAFFLAVVGLAHGQSVDVPYPERAARMVVHWVRDLPTQQPDKVLPWYQVAFRLWPRAKIAATLAGIYQQRKNAEHARQVWQQVVTATPGTSPDHWWAKAELALLDKDKELAARYFAEAARLYERAGKSTDAYFLYLRSGDLWQQARVWEKSAQSYRDALRLKPQSLDVYLKLGHLYQHQKAYEQALHWYREGERRVPYSYTPLYYQALTLQEMGRYEDALHSLDLALAKNPQAYWVLYAKATLLAQMDRRSEAVPVLEKAIELHPSHPARWKELKARWERYPNKRLDPDYWFERGRFQEKKRLWRTAASFYHYGARLAFPPDDYPLLLREALMWRYLRQWDRAITIYEDLIIRYPGRPDAYLELGEVYRRQGKYDEAFRWFYEAHERAPDKPHPLYYMGLARLGAKQYEDALKYFEQAIALNPQNAWYWYYKAVTLKALGRKQEAISALKRALSLHAHPPSSWPQTLREWQQP